MSGSETSAKDEKAILKEAIASRGESQTRIAERLGITQGALSINMRRERMSLDVFRNILDVLEYDIIVVDRKNGRRKWQLSE